MSVAGSTVYCCYIVVQSTVLNFELSSCCPLPSVNSGANPNVEGNGNTIMDERGWKGDSSNNINVQHQTEEEEVGYDAQEIPYSRPHSVVGQQSRYKNKRKQYIWSKNASYSPNIVIGLTIFFLTICNTFYSYSQTSYGGEMDSGQRRCPPFRGFAERYGAAASILSDKGPPPSPGINTSWDPLQSDTRANLRWRNRQVRSVSCPVDLASCNYTLWSNSLYATVTSSHTWLACIILRTFCMLLTTLRCIY